VTIGQRLDRTLLRMSMFAEGASVDFQKDRISSGKATASAPTDYQPLASEWEDRAERMVVSMEAEAEAYSTGAEIVQRKSASDLRRVIPSYEGRDIVFVAYHEGCSADLVRKVRTAMGLDLMGFRKDKPLTSRNLPEESC
jgi:hypothetical protein